MIRRERKTIFTFPKEWGVIRRQRHTVLHTSSPPTNLREAALAVPVVTDTSGMHIKGLFTRDETKRQIVGRRSWPRPLNHEP